MTTSGYSELPKTSAEWTKRAEDVLDRRSKSYVEDALVFAVFVRDHAQTTDNLTACQARSSELLEQRRCLARLIDAIAKAEPDSRDQKIAEALTAAKGMC